MRRGSGDDTRGLGISCGKIGIYSLGRNWVYDTGCYEIVLNEKEVSPLTGVFVLETGFARNRCRS